MQADASPEDVRESNETYKTFYLYKRNSLLVQVELFRASGILFRRTMYEFVCLDRERLGLE